MRHIKKNRGKEGTQAMCVRLMTFVLHPVRYDMTCEV